MNKEDIKGWKPSDIEILLSGELPIPDDVFKEPIDADLQTVEPLHIAIESIIKKETKMKKEKIREIATQMVSKMVNNLYANGNFADGDNMPFFYERKGIRNRKISRVQPFLYQMGGIYIGFGVVDEVIIMGRKRKNKFNMVVSCNAEIVADQLRTLYVEIYQKGLYKDHPDCHWYDGVKSMVDLKKIYAGLFDAFLEIFRWKNEFGIIQIGDDIALSLNNPMFDEWHDGFYVCCDRGVTARTYVEEGLEVDKSHQKMYDVLLN